MTTISPSRSGGAAPGATQPGGPRPPWPAWLPGGRSSQPEQDQARTARLRLRRRLVRWSLPAVVLLALVALKLVTMVALGEEARQAYAAGNITGVAQAAARLDILNVIEPHKAPFAAGDAKVLGGDLDGARADFEEALTLAPRDSREACQIRVNLVLSLQKLGDAAQAAGQAASATAYYERVKAVVAEAPQGCFQGDAADEEGQQLRDAQQRAQEQTQADRGDQQQPQNQQGQQGQPSQDKQQQLDDKTKDNLQQRSQGDQPNGSPSRPQVDKPW